MKWVNWCIALMVTGIVLNGCSPAQKKMDVLFQTSTIQALLNGVYEGEVTFEELKKHGNFGIGTLNGLDGEMIGINGRFYQIKDDGLAYPVHDRMKTPFAVVTSFEPDRKVFLNRPFTLKELEVFLDNQLPTKNIFYAFKIEGVFYYVKTRSVPKQLKPYPPLVDVVKNQSLFHFHGQRGTIVGFRLPEYMKGINVPGYHFHFITANRSAGGHLLDVKIEEVHIEIDDTSEFFMVLPKGKQFRTLDLSREGKKELEKVER